MTLVAVGLVAAAGAQQNRTAVCHYTGDPAAPYERLELLPGPLRDHLDHDLDIIPAPATCPTSTPVPEPEDHGDIEPEPGTPTPEPIAPPAGPPPRITICHAVGRDPVRYERLRLEQAGLDRHRGHRRDLIPAPVRGCPRRSAAKTPTRTQSRGQTAPAHAGAPASGAQPSATGALEGGLPVTGSPVLLIAMAGLGLLLSGSGLRLTSLPRR